MGQSKPIQQKTEHKSPHGDTPARKDQPGEGNYDATRRYNKALKEFVDSGQVDEAAEQAAPKNEQEAEQMRRAEAEGKRHAKEEDPQLHRNGKDSKNGGGRH